MAVSFFAGALVARYLGPEQYGIINYAISVVGIFGGLTALGLDRMIVRDLNKSEHEPNVILGTLIYLRFSGTLIAFSGALILGLVLGHEHPLFLMFVVIIAVSGVVRAADVAEVYFQSRMEMGKIVPARIMVLTATAAIRVLLVIFDANLLQFIMVSLVEGALITIAMLYLTRSTLGTIPLRSMNSTYLRRLLSQGWPLIIGVNLDVILSRYSSIIVQNFLGSEQLGYYAVAIRVVELLLVLSLLATNSFVPVLTRLHTKSREIYEDRLLFLTEIWTLTAFAGVIVGYFLLPPLIRLIFSEAFAPSGMYVVILLPSLIFQASGAYRAIHFTLENKQKHLLYINVFVLLASAPIYFGGVIIWQGVGVAAGFSLVNFISYVMVNLLFKDGREFLRIQLEALKLRQTILFITQKHY